MRIGLFCFIFCFSVCFGGEFRLKDRLEKAKAGDYIVTEANQTITLLAIRSITPKTLVLEEISAPSRNLEKKPSSWAEWVLDSAPGHTSWSMMEIDLQSGQILECFSFSRSSWVHLSQNESLFANLLQLPLKRLPQDQRKKIGPPPMDGEADRRKIWNPPLYLNGKEIKGAQFEVFTGVWPKDGSELSNRDVCLYFDKEKRVALPFWIQVETAHVTGALRTIDSGKNLPVIHRSIPRRVPEFVGLPQKTENGVRLSLKSPKYYREFELFAIDVTTKEKQIHPVNHSLILGEDEWVTVEIDENELQSALEPNHRYTWLIVPSGHSESYTQSHKPYLYSPEKN